MAAKKKAPWDRKNPKSGRSKEKTTHLTDADKAKAKRRAKKAGRPYPNLVDNMSIAAKKTSGRKRSSKKKVTKKKSTVKRANKK